MTIKQTGGIFGRSPTFANADVDGSLTTNELDLKAIAASKAVTAVDVFVYDTSKDSDGGAWRKRTQHTSWYNETLNTSTRGSRREFPAVAVIVAESDKVTIHDGDDPDLPMWMVFNDAGTNNERAFFPATFDVSCISALNGTVSFGLDVVSSASGLNTINFIADTLNRTGNTSARGGSYSGIVDRNTDVTLSGTVVPIVNGVVNDVAMTVLPDAPIDPATGLPVPTIAVATNGGVSVIKDDGTVVDSASTVGMRWVAFDGDGTLFFCTNASFYQLYKESLFAADGFGTYIGYSGAGLPLRLMTRVEDAYVSGATLFTSGSSAVSGVPNGTGGLQCFALSSANLSTSMSALLTSTYNTGWMNGSIKGAFLSDTDDTDLVGSGELVTNGTFDTDTSGWTASGNASLSVVSNRLRITNDSATNASAYQDFFTVTGVKYVVSLEQTEVSSRLLVGTPANASNALVTAFTTGTNLHTFIATGTTTRLTLQSAAGSVGEFSDFDNVSVKLADADRSVNNNGLIVNGTVTRTAVATGADLVAYSGFSSSNYLEQPYNSDLDFGTGDFCVMGWVKPSAFNAVDAYIVRSSVTSSTGGWIFGAASGSLRFWETQTTGYAGKVTAATALPLNTWSFACITRVSGVLYVYLNGVLSASAAFTNNINHGTPNASVGYDSDFNSYPASASALALWRISATAPTAEQISRIYNDEKHLFTEGAQATLFGSSDAVTALAFDDSSQLLHVGTSAGRSVFQGLRRVSNTTTAVGTAISASNGLVVEE